jgi:aromatic ring hydroxylase
VAFALPAMNEPADAAKGLSAIVEAVASGDLTPSEASELTNLVEGYVRVLESVDHEERLRALEGNWEMLTNHDRRLSRLEEQHGSEKPQHHWIKGRTRYQIDTGVEQLIASGQAKNTDVFQHWLVD